MNISPKNNPSGPLTGLSSYEADRVTQPPDDRLASKNLACSVVTEPERSLPADSQASQPGRISQFTRLLERCCQKMAPYLSAGLDGFLIGSNAGVFVGTAVGGAAGSMVGLVPCGVLTIPAAVLVGGLAGGASGFVVGGIVGSIINIDRTLRKGSCREGGACSTQAREAGWNRAVADAPQDTSVDFQAVAAGALFQSARGRFAPGY